MTTELTADLPGWESDSAPVPLLAPSFVSSDEPTAADEPKSLRRRARRSPASTEPTAEPPEPAGRGMAASAAALIDPGSPEVQQQLGRLAGVVFGFAGRGLHQARTPERTHGPNAVWIVTPEDKAALAGPAGELLARHAPAAVLAQLLPIAGLLGATGEVGDVLADYGQRNRTAEADLREMIRQEIAAQQEQQQNGGTG